MATKIVRTAKRTVALDARPDRPDVRDRTCQPRWLGSLPAPRPGSRIYLPKYRQAGLILNQGEEGLPRTLVRRRINYLFYRQYTFDKTPLSPPVSTRTI